MPDKQKTEKRLARQIPIETRLTELKRERRVLTTLSPEAALDRILAYDTPAALVHAIPEQDLHLLIHDIGPDDALPLLALANDRQWEFLVDLETWREDRVDYPMISRWLSRLYQADPDRTARWLMDEKVEWFELYLIRNIHVIVRDHDQDPSDFGKDVFSHDDTFYIRIGDHAETKTDSGIADAERRQLLYDLLQRIAVLDHSRYQKILLETIRLIPAEMEEELYRLKKVRLAEKGLLPPEEAIGIYQPLTADQALARRPKTALRIEAQATLLPVPAYPEQFVGSANRFSTTLAVIEDPFFLEEIQLELATLCNQIAVADHQVVREKDTLAAVVAKAGGYLSIGLERLCTVESGGFDPQTAATLLKTRPLTDIFRVGYGAAVQLKWRAEKWQRESGFHKMGFPLTFWDEKWLGVLGGLLIKRPMFFDNYARGTLYREFESLADIEETRAALDAIQAVDDLVAALDLSVDPAVPVGALTYRILFLTAWAQTILGLEGPVRHLTLSETRQFFTRIWAESEPPFSVTGDARTDLSEWLGSRTAGSGNRVRATAEALAGTLLDELVDEYGQVPIRSIDPRFVRRVLCRKSD